MSSEHLVDVAKHTKAPAFQIYDHFDHRTSLKNAWNEQKTHKIVKLTTGGKVDVNSTVVCVIKTMEDQPIELTTSLGTRRKGMSF